MIQLQTFAVLLGITPMGWGFGPFILQEGLSEKEKKISKINILIRKLFLLSLLVTVFVVLSRFD